MSAHLCLSPWWLLCSPWTTWRALLLMARWAPLRRGITHSAVLCLLRQVREWECCSLPAGALRLPGGLLVPSPALWFPLAGAGLGSGGFSSLLGCVSGSAYSQLSPLSTLGVPVNVLHPYLLCWYGLCGFRLVCKRVGRPPSPLMRSPHFLVRPHDPDHLCSVRWTSGCRWAALLCRALLSVSPSWWAVLRCG